MVSFLKRFTKVSNYVKRSQIMLKGLTFIVKSLPTCNRVLILVFNPLKEQ